VLEENHQNFLDAGLHLFIDTGINFANPKQNGPEFFDVNPRSEIGTPLLVAKCKDLRQR
jgi:hypothetical protein